MDNQETSASTSDGGTQQPHSDIRQDTPRPRSPIEWLGYLYHNRKPWDQFFEKFCFPNSSDFTLTVWTNIHFFETNYLYLFSVLILYCLVTVTPYVLTAFFLALASTCYLKEKCIYGVTICNGYKIPLVYQWLFVAVIFWPIFVLLGASAAFYRILGVTILLIFLHATFYAADLPEERESPFQQV